MAGVVRVSKKRSDLWGRLPLVKSKAGESAYRDAGTETLTKNEKALANVILSANDLIPTDAAQRLIDGGDIATYNRTVLNALAPLQDEIEVLLRKQLIESAIATTREAVQNISNDYAAIGKAEALTPPLPSKVVLQHSFDYTSPATTAFAKKQSAQLVTNMVESQREAIRQVVARAYTVGRTPAQLQTDLVAALRLVNPTTDPAKSLASLFGTNVNGLTARYETAVATRAEKIAKDLAKKGITGSKALEKVKKDTQKYADKLRKARARTIARTEMMTANNEGKLQSFLQMEKKGIISPKNSRKQWSTGRFDVCKICAPLNGQLQPLNKPFSTGRMTPPAHPNCRCTMMLVTDVKTHTPPQPIGGNTPDNPLGFTPGDLTPAGQTAAETPIVIDVIPQASDVIPVNLKPATTSAQAQDLADETLGAPNVPPAVDTSPPADISEAFKPQEGAVTYPSSNKNFSYTHNPDGTTTLQSAMSDKKYLVNADGSLTFQTAEGLKTVTPTDTSFLGQAVKDLPPNPFAPTSQKLSFPETENTYAFTHQPDGSTIIQAGENKYVLGADGQVFSVNSSGELKLAFPPTNSGLADTIKFVQAEQPNPFAVAKPPALIDVTPVKPATTIVKPEGIIKVPNEGFIPEHEYWPNGDVHLTNLGNPPKNYLITPKGDVYMYDGITSEQIIPKAGSTLEDLVEHLKVTENPFMAKTPDYYNPNVTPNIPKAQQKTISVPDGYGDTLTMNEISNGVWEYESPLGYKYRYVERTNTWFDEESVGNFVSMSNEDGAIPNSLKLFSQKLQANGLKPAVNSSSQVAPAVTAPKAPIKVPATIKLPPHNVQADGVYFTNKNGQLFVIKKDKTVFRVLDDGTLGSKFTPEKGSPLHRLFTHYTDNPQLFDDPFAPLTITPVTSPTVATPTGPVTPQPSLPKPSQAITGPWDVPDVKGGLKLDAQASAKLGGQNPKQVYTDATGQQWIFKPQERWQAELETATNQTMELLGVPHAEVELVTINGQTGSLHKVLAEGGRVDEVKPAFGNSGVFDPTKLSPDQIEALQQNQIADWIIGNYDSHTEQFVRLSSSSDSSLIPIGIDKGQAFKHLGKMHDVDNSSLYRFLENGSHYNPNNNAPSKMAYQKLWDDFLSGKGVNVVKPSESKKIQLLVNNVQKITQRGTAEHRAFIDLWRNYADEAFKAGKLPSGMTPNQFLDTLMRRLDDVAENVRRQEKLLLQTDAWKIKTGRAVSVTSPETTGLDASLLARQYQFHGDDFFNTNYRSLTEGLSRYERDALYEYSGNQSADINGALRDGFANYQSTVRQIKEIDAAMAKSVLQHDVKVTRNAARWSKADGTEVSLKDAIGKVIVHDNFVSTTIRQGGVFMGDSLEISVPAGTRGIWLKPISRHAGEDELLIDRGYRIVITGQRVQGSKTIYEGVLLPDEVATKAIPAYVKKPVPKAV